MFRSGPDKTSLMVIWFKPYINIYNLLSSCFLKEGFDKMLKIFNVIINFTKKTLTVYVNLSSFFVGEFT